MSYNDLYVDHGTLLFHDIPDQLRPEMLELARAIILKGKGPAGMPDWARMWFKAAGLPSTEQQQDHCLLMWTTAFPQRLLLSLLEEPQVTK
jgi:hypothetical protein